MKVKETIEEYLLYKKGHVAENTYKNYTGTLNEFCNFLGNKNIKNIKFIDYLRFIESFEERDYKKTTISNKIHAIKGYLKYLKINKMVDFPFELIKTPKREEYRHNVCSRFDFDALCDYLDDDIEKLLVLRLLWITGLRIHELLKIRIDEIDLRENETLLKIGKNGKIYSVIWDDETGKLMRSYVAEKLCRDRVYLIGKSARTIERWFEDFSEIVGHKITPHAMRHGRAHYMLGELGATLNDVKNYLRHMSITSTQMYARQNKKERMRTLERFAVI